MEQHITNPNTDPTTNPTTSPLPPPAQNTAPLLAARPPDHDDHDDHDDNDTTPLHDEGYANSTTSSFLTSLASSVIRGVDENGRLYPNYGRHEYGMPIDEQELDRNDLQHAKFKLILEGRLFLAPVLALPLWDVERAPESAADAGAGAGAGAGARVLDVGTGTGIWAIEMGDAFPQAEVVGTDIAPTQPTWVPPNVQFVVEDAEEEWGFKDGSFDLVFGREITFAVRDWEGYVAQALRVLKPGGWLELAATYPRPFCDDGSIDLQESVLVKMVEIYFEIVKAMGCSLENARRWVGLLEEAGFVEVQERWFKMPIGPWAKDKRLKHIGHFELAQLNQGYEAYMMRGWTHFLQRPPAELYALIAEGRKEIHNPRHHAYAHLWVFHL